jgi:hypothetical protein
MTSSTIIKISCNKIGEQAIYHEIQGADLPCARGGKYTSSEQTNLSMQPRMCSLAYRRYV